MYQFWLHFLPACPGSWLISSLLAPLSGVGLMSCKVLRKAPFIFKILGRATASHLVLTKQISSYCQSKASENCRSQTRGSGFWAVIITVWNKKIYLKKKKGIAPLFHEPTEQQKALKVSVEKETGLWFSYLRALSGHTSLGEFTSADLPPPQAVMGTAVLLCHCGMQHLPSASFGGKSCSSRTFWENISVQENASEPLAAHEENALPWSCHVQQRWRVFTSCQHVVPGAVLGLVVWLCWFEKSLNNLKCPL